MNKKIILAGLVATITSLPAFATLTLVEKDQWKFSMAGFAELDTIVDSTRSFTEVVGNGAVARPETLNGETGRTQMSIRNSRLDFILDAPETDGWKSKGFFEFDLLGYDPAPGTPTGAVNSEASFFNNPTFRVRHVYLAAEKDGWQLMGGQYWMLLGWQPYYFMPSIQPAPQPGMLYGRTSQVRGTKNWDVASDSTLQAAVGVMRPPQRDASYPGLEGGLRFAWSGRNSGFTAGATGAQKAQPMSVAVSGALREFEMPASPDMTVPTRDRVHLPGMALAVDALMPVLSSADGKDVSNTLTLGGEFTTGKGYGDQFASWTGGLPNPLASGSSVTTLERNVNIDGGIGAFDSSGRFQLVNLQTFNAYFQYHLPSECRTWFSGGYGRLFSNNVDLLTVGATGKTAGGSVPYHRTEALFGNVFHDLTKALRVGVEYAYTRTGYQDGEVAHNNRYQLSMWFLF